MIGQRVSHYLIEERLGAGGMGEVFRARDLALGRTAAIKLLASDLDAELRATLTREADASARLQHPAIATFFESGESDGRTFLAMEYVRGRTLREALRHGPLSRTEAIRVVARVLEGLGHAHAAGILHRDVKPENVMLTERGAKLLDFGLAKPLSTAGTSAPAEIALTRTGVVVGTPGYVAPERFRGEALDATSDLYCAGLLLFESLTGQRLLTLGGDAEARRAAETASALGGALGSVLARALAPEPRDRFATAAEFLTALRDVDEGASGDEAAGTLAVTDFANLSGDERDAWIGSGVAESLATDLARRSGVRVLPRPGVARIVAALRQEGREPDALAIGQRMGCRWMLSGGFQKLGPRLRFTLQLLEVDTARTLAGEKLDTTLDELFDAQDRLSEIALSHLPRAEAPATRARLAASVTAIEAYEEGERWRRRLEKGAFDRAIVAYERALETDPTLARAYAGLAGVHVLRFTYTTDSRELELGVEYARRALELDPRLAEAHVWGGYGWWRLGELNRAAESFHAGAAVDPTNLFAPYFEGCLEYFDGRPREAIPGFQRSLAISPTYGMGLLGLSWAHFDAGNTDDALWCIERAVALEGTGVSPSAAGAGFLAEMLRRLGRLTEARARCVEGLESVERTDHMYRDTFRGCALATLGRIALDQGDAAGARAAFGQLAAHVRGRPRMLGGGHLLVQALAGQARAGEGAALYEEARQLDERRGPYDFSFIWGCQDSTTRRDLEAAS